MNKSSPLNFGNMNQRLKNIIIFLFLIKNTYTLNQYKNNLMWSFFMKISSEEKKKLKNTIIDSAVHLFIVKGINNTTMREISRNANIADATIYKYFKSKEKIIIAYFERHFLILIKQVKEVDGFNSFSMKEQFQCCFDLSLELFLADREFVKLAFKNAFFNYSYDIKEVKRLRELFNQISIEILEAAIEVNEIPEQSMTPLINQAIFDYYLLVVLYWLKDESDDFSGTSIFMDKSLDIIDAFLRSGLINKFFDFFSYLFKTHLMDLMGIFKEGKKAGSFIKREFMGKL